MTRHSRGFDTEAAFAHLGMEARLSKQTEHGLSETIDVAVGDHCAAVAYHLGQAAVAVGDDGDTRRHALHRW